MLTPSQLADARATYASMVISDTSLSEAEAMEIAARFYASGEPERIAALPPVAGPELRADRGRVAAGWFAQRLKEKPKRMVV